MSGVLLCLSLRKHRQEAVGKKHDHVINKKLLMFGSGKQAAKGLTNKDYLLYRLLKPLWYVASLPSAFWRDRNAIKLVKKKNHHTKGNVVDAMHPSSSRTWDLEIGCRRRFSFTCEAFSMLCAILSTGFARTFGEM